jgi:hypothetical protein
VFSGPFTYDCVRFPHGAQQDTYNCGIFTINAIGHVVIGDPVLIADEANNERLKWFALFAKTAVSGNQPVQPDLANLLNPLDGCFTTGVSPYEEAFELVEEATDILSDTHITDTDMNLDDSSDPPTSIPPSTLIPPSTTHSSAPEDAGSVESEVEVPDQQVMPIHSGDAAKAKLKRSFQFSSDDSDKYETDDDSRPMKKRGKGKSRSAISSLRVREALRKGTFKVDDERLKAWKVQISRDDHGATFDPSNIRRVRHSICGGWVVVKQPFDRTRWNTHLKKCATKKNVRHEKPSAHMATLKSMGFFNPGPKKEAKASDASASVKGFKAATTQDPPKVDEYPCPGLSDADDGRVSKYLSRTQVLRAGSVSLQKIVEEIHGADVRYVDLDEAKRKRVVDEHEHRQTWRNIHERRKVYAVDCHKVVSEPHNGERAFPCTNCLAVLRSKRFKNALQRDAPDEKNTIYIPNKFRNTQIAQIYARCRGLQGIVEKAVSHYHIWHNMNTDKQGHKGCSEKSIRSVCPWCAGWKI